MPRSKIRRHSLIESDLLLHLRSADEFFPDCSSEFVRHRQPLPRTDLLHQSGHPRESIKSTSYFEPSRLTKMNISIKLIALAATFFLHHASAAAFAVKNDRRPACIGSKCAHLRRLPPSCESTIGPNVVIVW